MKTKTCKIQTIQKEFVEVEVLKSSTQHSFVKQVFALNISEEDIEPQPSSPLQEIIILNPDDQPTWESAKTLAPTPDPVIARPNIDDNFVINSTHLKMICENNFVGNLRADPHDHICEFLASWHGLTKGAIIQIFYHGLDKPTQAILDVTTGGIFLYKSPNQPFQFLDDKVLFELDWSNKLQMKPTQNFVAFVNGSDKLKKEMHEMRKNSNNREDNQASIKNMNDDTCPRSRIFMRLDHSRRLRAYELDSCHVARPMRNKERASWDLGTGSHKVLGKVIVGEFVRLVRLECRLGKRAEMVPGVY
nr:hypothetical protein [Tanacetum cinerariifolium]